MWGALIGAAASLGSAYMNSKGGGGGGGGVPVGNVEQIDKRTAVTDHARLAQGTKNTIVDGDQIVAHGGEITHGSYNTASYTVIQDSRPALDLASKTLDRAGDIADSAIGGAARIAADAIDYAAGVGSDAFEAAVEVLEHGGQIVDAAIFSNEDTAREAMDHTAQTFQAALDFADASRAAAFAESRQNTDAALMFADEKTKSESARLMQLVVMVGGTVVGIIAIGYAAKRVLK